METSGSAAPPAMNDKRTQPPIPTIKQGVDLRAVSLSPEEGFVFSRIDGRTKVPEIAALTGRTPTQAEQILTRLAKLGLIAFGDIVAEPQRPSSAPTSATESGEIDYGGYIFQPGLMHEPGTLDETTRKRIIWLHEHIASWNHYQLLQVSRKDDEKLIKKAYHLRSKEWHPDSFRQKDLGSFKKMIETVYKQINQAYTVLCDPAKRVEYDKTVIFEPEPEELEAMARDKARAERDKVREEEHKKKRFENNPIRKRMDKARQFYEEALKLEKIGKFMDALRQAQLAVTYDDKPDEFKVLIERLNDAAGEDRIGKFMKRGQQLESMLRWDEAIEMFQEAVRIAPNSPKPRLRLAYCLLQTGKEEQDALQHAQKAVAGLPEDAEAQYVLGRYYEMGGMEKLAKRAYQQALTLKPNYGEVKKRLTKLKWGF